MLIRLSNSEALTSKKLCKECVFYHPKNNQCKRFYQICLVDGEVKHPRVESVRYLDEYCGLEGKYYKKKDFKYEEVLMFSYEDE